MERPRLNWSEHANPDLLSEAVPDDVAALNKLVLYYINRIYLAAASDPPFVIRHTPCFP